MSPKSWPALDIGFEGGASPVPDPEGYFAAFLDDYSPTAIIDTSTASGPAWRIFFSSNEARAAAEAAITREWDALHVTSVDVPDEQWAERSQAQLTAVQAGRIVVTPPWDLERAHTLGDPASIVVVIEPSMGFGTGHHESTRLCLLALQQTPLAGKDVLDLGTGSGVLAIAAALLGCRQAVALDDDPDAVAAAEQNATLNRVGERVAVRRADLATATAMQADVVLGNLTGALLRKHSEAVRSRVAPGGTLILSGFTEDEHLAVAHAFEPCVVVREDVENGWLALTLRVPAR